MLTQVQNRWLSDHVYLLDSFREDKNLNLKVGSTHAYSEDNEALGSFQIIAIVDNTENGMQVIMHVRCELTRGECV